MTSYIRSHSDNIKKTKKQYAATPKHSFLEDEWICMHNNITNIQYFTWPILVLSWKWKKINKRLNYLYFSYAINCYKIHFVSYLCLHKKNMAGLYNLKHNFQWPNPHLTLCSTLSPFFPSFLLSFPFIFLSNRLFCEQWGLVWTV